jgi:hypothetical protein
MSTMMYENHFEPNAGALGPSITINMIQKAEKALGIKLPVAYIELLSIQNGGRFLRKRFLTTFRTSWAKDHFEVSSLLGIGYDDGLDGQFGSDYLIREWAYPRVGLVIFDTPASGPDVVMLDYSDCGYAGQPSVVYVDEDRIPRRVADSFSGFVSGLV